MSDPWLTNDILPVLRALNGERFDEETIGLLVQRLAEDLLDSMWQVWKDEEDANISCKHPHQSFVDWLRKKKNA